MSNLTVFNFDSSEVRVIDQNGEPLFVAKDIAATLGYTDTRQAVRRHCKHAKSLIELGGLSAAPQQNQELDPQTKLIPESDVYRLIMASKLSSAQTAKSAIIKQVSDTRSVLNALNDFEVPDDLPDMYVYAIRECDTGNIKLGISRDPEQRLKQMQTGNSSRLELVSYREAKNRFKDERALHFKAADYRIRGEWFNHNAMEVMQ